MSVRVRSSGLWPQQGKVPQVREQEVEPSTQRLRHFRQGFASDERFHGSLRFLRRSARAGLLLARRSRLNSAFLSSRWQTFGTLSCMTEVTFVCLAGPPTIC